LDNIIKTDKKKIITLAVVGIVIGTLASAVNILLALAVLAVIAGIAIVMSNYEVSVYILTAYAIVDYALRTAVPSLASIWDEAFLCALVLLCVFKWVIYRKDGGVRVSPMDLPIIFFIVTMLCVLLINSADFSIGLEGFRAIVQYIFWYFVVIQLVKDEKSARRIAVCFALVTGLMALHGVFQYAIGVEMPEGWVDQNEAGVRTRVFSILTSPNVFGSLLTLSTPITVALAISEENKKRRVIFGFLALMMSASLVFTFSRGAWIGFALACGFYILLKDKRFIIPAIIAAVLLVVCVPSVGNRIAYMLSPEYIESSLRGGRLVRWSTGLRILNFYPIFGVGLGQFGGAVAMNHNLQVMLDCGYQRTFYMDNYFLKTAVESGIVGFTAFVILMYSVIINSYRTIKMSVRVGDKKTKELCIGIMSGLLGVIVHNCVENVFETPLMVSLFWLFVGVIMSLWYINRQKLKNKEK
jgi:O-antigen ligase